MCKCRSVTVKLRTLKRNMKKKSLTPVRELNKRDGLMRNSDIAIYTMVTLTAVFSYLNSLNGEFVHDDIPAIVTNGDVTGANSLKELFLNDFWGTPMSDVNSHKSYRPLTTLSFRLNYALAGLLPWWWHAWNVALHAACCALVARACVTIARLQRPFAALAALLFAVHPVHTEAVAGVVGRADVLACIFFLCSILVYHGSTNNKKYVWLSIVMGALSMLAKETGVTVLLLNLVFDFYRCWPFVKRSIYSLKIEKKCSGLSIRTAKVLISLGVLVSVRLAMLQGALPSFSPQDNPAAFHPSFFVRLMTFCYLATFNWWLLLCPWTLSHDWQMGSVPLITSGWDPRNLLTCAALGALLLLCHRCFLDLEVQRHTPAVIGLLMLTAPFVPASNVLVTVGFVVAERVLYIPSVGSVIITAYGVQLMWYSKPGAKVLLVIGLAVLAASGVARTYRRNNDWKDRGTLLRADLATVPQNAKLHYNFANFLREAEHQDTAIKHYKEALRLWPSYASAHNNLGTLVAAPDGAEHHFLQAIQYNKNHVNAHYNLGKLYKKTGRTSQAVIMLEKCLTLQPSFVQAHLELLTLKSDEDKLKILRTLIRLESNNWEHYVLYGDWWRLKGLAGVALGYYLEATKLSFAQRNAGKPHKGDLISFRNTALMYRAMGQKSKILQILIRWHIRRRGGHTPSYSYLREWTLKIELQGRALAYSRAANPTKSTKCFDSTQLSVDSNHIKDKNSYQETEIIQNDIKSVIDSKIRKTTDTNKNCIVKKRNVSISSQIKMTHNKSESGHKDKSCDLRRKEINNIKNRDLIPNIGSTIPEHILMKSY